MSLGKKHSEPKPSTDEIDERRELCELSQCNMNEIILKAAYTTFIQSNSGVHVAIDHSLITHTVLSRHVLQTSKKRGLSVSGLNKCNFSTLIGCENDLAW